MTISKLLLTAAMPVVTHYSAEFISIGDLPEGDTYSRALDLSGDGTTVLGESADAAGEQLFRWSESGFSLLPFFMATQISGDGSVVVGADISAGLHAARWTEATGLVSLAADSPDDYPLYSLAYNVSNDGNTVVGTAVTGDPNASSEALSWSIGVSWMLLGFLPEDQPLPGFLSRSEVMAASGDGTVLAGASSSTAHADRVEMAFRWTALEGMEPLGVLPPNVQSVPTAVSVDGSVIVGYSGFDAFRWTRAAGLERIGYFTPAGVSADGNTIVGTDTSIFPNRAMIWTADSGEQPLETYLRDTVGLSLPAWQLFTEMVGISDDGLVVAGNGINAQGLDEAFLVKLNQAAPIPADSDGDGIPDSLDAVPLSDMSSTILVNDFDTGLPNRVLADGSTLNDLIAVEAAKAENHGEFVSAIAGLTKLWSQGGILPKEAKSLIQTAAAQSN